MAERTIDSDARNVGLMTEGNRLRDAVRAGPAPVREGTCHEHYQDRKYLLAKSHKRYVFRTKYSEFRVLNVLGWTADLRSSG